MTHFALNEEILISAIKPDMVPLIWDRVRPMIEMAIEHSNGELCLTDMYERIQEQRMLLLTITEGDTIVACLTIEKRDFPTGKSILNVTTAGGADLHIWMSLVDRTLTKLAKERGCDEIYIVGRQGWQRMLKKLNYKPIHSVVGKKIED